jgi:hypothetical protein
MRARVLLVTIALAGSVALSLARGESAEEHLRVSTLYDRIAAKMERNPELAEAVGQPSAEIGRAAWMIGRWKVTSRIFAKDAKTEPEDHGESTVEEILGGTWLQIRDTYDAKPQDHGFLTFNVATKEWIAIGIDKTGNAITSKARGWDGSRLSLVAENAEILGERVVLRQTLEKQSDRQYRILNEERLPSGEWAVIDEYVYRKQ